MRGHGLLDKDFRDPREQHLDQTLSADLTPEQQLVMLRETVRRTGVLHEAQALQLRLWPFAVDPELPVDGVEAKVDLDNKKVTYLWRDKNRSDFFKPDKAYKTRLEHLIKSVKWLLGQDYVVSVLLNGNTIFVSHHGQNSTKKRRRRRRRKKS